MRYFEAPTAYNKFPKDFGVFLGGGITDCPDWQADIRKQLEPTDFFVMNPRRKYFDVSDKSAAPKQIAWEHKAMRDADVIVFWFPSETLCPITLYELGAWSMTKKPLVVGCHPQYERRLDVEVQTSLARPEIYVVDSINAVLVQLYSVHRALTALR